jgi:hypothetical protein
MQSQMFRLRSQKLQVLNSIVAAVSVFVMDNLFSFKETAKVFLHDQAMLVHIAVAISGRMTFGQLVHIAFVSEFSAFKMIWAVTKHRFGAARPRARLKPFCAGRIYTQHSRTDGALQLNEIWLHPSIVIPTRNYA